MPTHIAWDHVGVLSSAIALSNHFSDFSVDCFYLGIITALRSGFYCFNDF